jgi:hypothetical protein
MTKKRKVEIFSAECPICEEAVLLVNRLACDSCDVTVLDMKNSVVSERAQNLGIRSVPAMVIDGELADCCRQGINEERLKAAGLGQPLSEN